MNSFIQIGPNVVFSSVVLSPNWRRECQGTEAISRQEQVGPASSRVAAGAVREARSQDDGSRAQLKLL